jgi:hypothetical protein
VYGADGSAQKIVEGNDWRLECPAARELQEQLHRTPPEGGVWNFL